MNHNVLQEYFKEFSINKNFLRKLGHARSTQREFCTKVLFFSFNKTIFQEFYEPRNKMLSYPFHESAQSIVSCVLIEKLPQDIKELLEIDPTDWHTNTYALLQTEKQLALIVNYTQQSKSSSLCCVAHSSNNIEHLKLILQFRRTFVAANPTNLKNIHASSTEFYEKIQEELEKLRSGLNHEQYRSACNYLNSRLIKRRLLSKSKRFSEKNTIYFIVETLLDDLHKKNLTDEEKIFLQYGINTQHLKEIKRIYAETNLATKLEAEKNWLASELLRYTHIPGKQAHLKNKSFSSMSKSCITNFFIYLICFKMMNGKKIQSASNYGIWKIFFAPL